MRTVLLKPAQLAVAHYTDRRDRPIRDLVGRLSAMLVEDPVVKLAEFDGIFALSPRSHIFRRIATEGHYEPILTAKCREWLDRDRDVIDVGANYGEFLLNARYPPEASAVGVEANFQNGGVRLEYERRQGDRYQDDAASVKFRVLF